MFQSPCQIFWSDTQLHFICLRLGLRFCDICNLVAVTADSKYSPNKLKTMGQRLSLFRYRTQHKDRELKALHPPFATREKIAQS